MTKLELIKETHPDYDYLFDCMFEDKYISYGIINGNNKVLFIKSGLEGSLVGYKDKYYNLARFVNKKYGYTVVCSNNPKTSNLNQLSQGIEIINAFMEELKFDSFGIYCYGNSNGGVIMGRYAYLYPNIKKLLLINPPLFISYHKLKDGILKFNNDKITFIYGTLDPSYKFVEFLDLLNTDKVSYVILENEDHNLSNNTYSLEELVDKYLLNE